MDKFSRILYIKPQGSHYAAWVNVNGETVSFTFLSSVADRFRDRSSLESWIEKKAAQIKEEADVA